MILLTSTSDKIQVITSAAGTVGVHASYIDLASGTVTAGRLNTNISTATTTDVVASPGASTSRNVKRLFVSNNHASVTNTVTVQHTDGTTVIPIEQVSLPPGWRLGYEEGNGLRLFDGSGREVITNTGQSTGNANTADVTANAADTYLTGASLPIAGRVQAGSFFKWRFRITKTAASTATPTFNIRTGTGASTSDSSRCLFTSTAAQTAATDTAMIEMDAIFRSVGATAVLAGVIRMDHTSADGAGFGTFRYLSTISASFDVTAAGTIIGVSCNPGTAGVWTFQNVSVEGNNLIS